MRTHGAKVYHGDVVQWVDQQVGPLPLGQVEFDTAGFAQGDSLLVPHGLDGIYIIHGSAYVRGHPIQDAPVYVVKNYPGSGDFNTCVIRGSQVTPYTAQPHAVGGIAQTSAIEWLRAGDRLQLWLYVDNDHRGGVFGIGGGSSDPPGEAISLAFVRVGSDVSGAEGEVVR